MSNSTIDRQDEMPETLFYRPAVNENRFSVDTDARASTRLASLVGGGIHTGLWYGEYKLVRKFVASFEPGTVRIHE